MNTGFLGRDGFVWFVGVVEDRHDPEKLGRVRVRALGYHTENKDKIKTADLPWAEVMQPVGSNAMAGIGDSPIGIVEGSWVVGFFRDPDAMQEPVIMGTLPGKNTRVATQMDAHGPARGTDNQFGFYDPTTVSDDLPYEPDTTTHVGSGSGGTVTAKPSEEDLKILSYIEMERTVAALKTDTATISSHSQGLYDTFGTTRRLTIPTQKDSGENYGVGSTSTERTHYWSATNVKTDWDEEKINSKVISTGYLEDDDTRDTTNGPFWPLTKEKADGDRMPYPRLETILKSGLTTAQSTYIRGLFEDGVYGSTHDGEFFDDLSSSTEIILPRNDTNRLAQGGATITDINATATTITLSYKVKPNVGKDDKVQFAGIVGMEVLNGQTFTLTGASLGATSGTVEIAAPSQTPLGEYVRGGTMLADPHPMLASKANARERQINIGGEDLNSVAGYSDDGKYAGYWNQPSSRYAAEYPYNHVYESESGHVKEFDDTPGAERIHEYHRSGTYYEVDQEGTKVDYVKGDRYNISVHDDYLYVKGQVIWTGDNDVLIAANEKMSLTSKWRMKVASGGDIEVYSKRNLNFRADGDINMVAGGHINIEGECTKESDKTWKIPSGTRAAETPSRISMTAGTMEFFVPAPEVEVLPAASHGRIDFNAHHRISMKVHDGYITREASAANSAIIDTADGIYFNSEHAKSSPSASYLAENKGNQSDVLGIGQGYGAAGEKGKQHIAYTPDVLTYTTGQGKGLGIDKTTGDNIRKLRK